MKNPYFGRLLTAMVTPFNADGSVNYENAADLADWLIAHGSNGFGLWQVLPAKRRP